MNQEDPIVCLVSDLRRSSSQQCIVSLHDGWWVFNPIQATEYPHQGWKLHISALPVQASSILQVVAPVLIEHTVRWKVCQDLKRLIELLSVPSAYSQVGKFITIYPRTEEQALELAAILHGLTAEYSGPVIPTDKRYAPGSQLYYRYGGFAQLEFYDPDTSLKTPYMLTPGGEKVYDRRAAGLYCPDWVANPFPDEQKPRVPQAGKGLFGKDMTVIGVLRQSAKGGVYIVRTPSGTAVLKEARLGTNPDLTGRDARDRLVNEYEILRKLAPLEIAPQPLEFFHADQNSYLLMEHLAGRSLATYIEQRNYLGDDDRKHLRSICLSLIKLVQTCQATGVIIRDFTPNNVLVTQRGCTLVDLELAWSKENERAPFTGFTPGYVRPGRELSARQTVQDDLYALGAVLCFTLTGIPPHLLVRDTPEDGLENVLSLFLRDSTLHDFLSLAVRYLGVEPEDEVCSLAPLSIPELLMRPLADAACPDVLALPGNETPALAISLSSHTLPVQPPASGALPFDWETLQANATAAAQDLYQTAAWRSADRLWTQSKLGSVFHPACFHTGAAGVAYYLCAVAQATGDATYYAYAAEVMDWTLSTHPFIPEESPAGLYFGYAAIPWVLTLLARGLNDTHYVDQALSLARHISCAPLRHLDITHGAAGRGLMHLAMYDCLGDQEQLTHAINAAEYIMEQKEESAAGTITWLNQGKRLWGFAHGAAGLAYFLLRLSMATDNLRYRSLAEKTGHSLIKVAVPTTHGQGLTWPMGPADTTTRWTHWCNGASGVGLYFLEAAQVLQNAEFERMALLAANTIRFGHSFGACCQCHGLAGEGDYLLQVGRELSHREMEQGAWNIARKLFALRLTRHPYWQWSEETRLQAAPDYMTGYCGVYTFLLRLFRQNLCRPFLQRSAPTYPERALLARGENPSW